MATHQDIIKMFDELDPYDRLQGYVEWRNKDLYNKCKLLPYEELVKLQEYWEKMPVDHKWIANLPEDEYQEFIDETLPMFNIKHFPVATDDERIYDLVKSKYINFETIVGQIQTPKYIFEIGTYQYTKDYECWEALLRPERKYKMRNDEMPHWWNKEKLVELLTLIDNGTVAEPNNWHLRRAAHDILSIDDHIDYITEHSKLWDVGIDDDRHYVADKQRLFEVIVKHAPLIAANIEEDPNHDDYHYRYGGSSLPSGWNWIRGFLQKKSNLTLANLKALSLIEKNLQVGRETIEELYGKCHYIDRVNKIHNPSWYGNGETNPMHMKKIKTGRRISCVTSVALPNTTEDLDSKFIYNVDLTTEEFEALISKIAENVQSGGVQLNDNGRLTWNYDVAKVTRSINDISTVKQKFDDLLNQVDDSEKKTIGNYVSKKLHKYLSKDVKAKLGDPKSAPIHLINNLAEVELEDSFMHRFEHFCDKFGLELNDLPGMVEDLIERKSTEMV
jgi:hypothetical protein